MTHKKFSGACPRWIAIAGKVKSEPGTPHSEPINANCMV